MRPSIRTSPTRAAHANRTAVPPRLTCLNLSADALNLQIFKSYFIVWLILYKGLLNLCCLNMNVKLF